MSYSIFVENKINLITKFYLFSTDFDYLTKTSRPNVARTTGLEKACGTLVLSPNEWDWTESLP